MGEYWQERTNKGVWLADNWWTLLSQNLKAIRCNSSLIAHQSRTLSMLVEHMEVKYRHCYLELKERSVTFFTERYCAISKSKYWTFFSKTSKNGC